MDNDQLPPVNRDDTVSGNETVGGNETATENESARENETAAGNDFAQLNADLNPGLLEVQNESGSAADSEQEELCQRLRESGKEALADFFVQNRARLHRMVSLRLDRRLLQRVDASDVLQEGFVDAAKRLGEYLQQPEMPLFVWVRFLVGQKLAAIHRLHFHTQKRDPRREELAASQKTPPIDSDVLAEEFSASMTSPSNAVARAELTQRMLQVLETLDPMDREILVMRHFEELSNSEAAAELGLAPGTASKRYMRALGRLRQAMNRWTQPGNRKQGGS